MRAVLVIGAVAVVLTTVLLHVIETVGMMPVAAAVEAVIVDHAFDGMLWVTVPIFSLVVTTLLYSLFKFRSRSLDEEGAAFHGSRGGLVEATWLLTSLGLTLGLAAFGVREIRLIRGTDQADLNVQLTAVQWSWDFYYPKYKYFGTDLLLPKGKRVRLLMQSEDVLHAFWVPEFRVKQDIVPGRVIKLLFTPTRLGSYALLCAELCGRDHTTMSATVRVVEPEEFEELVQQEW